MGEGYKTVPIGLHEMAQGVRIVLPEPANEGRI
jgi:hypothetical protein